MKRKRKLNLLLAVLLAIVQIVQISGPLGVRAAEADRNSEGDDFTGIYSEKYFEPSKSNRNWCEGMVSGNGKNGVITSGAPYSDTLIYQNMMFNMPNNNYREVLPGIEDDLEKARAAVINRDTSWNYDGQERQRYYTFHPGHQLRITMEEIPYENYRRWTNYETAEVGVSYTDRYGEWERTTFTSRADDVTITRIQQSSDNRKVSLTLSIDNISDLRGFGSGPEGAYERYIEYKKIVDDDLNYIAQVAHYPVTDRGTEFNEAGYAGMTQVITIGGEKEKVILDGEKDSQNAGEDANPGIKIIGADAVYLITKSARTFDMGKMEDFAENENYEIVDRLYEETNQAAGKYMKDGNFDYNAALQAHVELHKPQFDAVKLDLKSSESDRNLSTEELLEKQKNTNGLNEAFVERAYYAGRYAQLCCSGYSTSRLGGMWTGEWNSPWGGLYTTDANVNIQVSAMNTANMAYTPIGYISFILRQAGDWLTNAEVVYGMHDAIQAPHNTDGDCAVMIQSDAAYPMQYWNAGASWLLLPIYEYWQCYGNQQIPIPEDVDLYEIKGVLGTEDGGLSDEEVSVIIERGYLDLEKDILLPLLTKLCNFWQQLCTPEYYTDVEGEHRYEKGKKGLEEGERYVLIPTYSPENAPKGSYNKPTTLNATMDIAAARDSLDMASAVEKAVNGENGSEQIKVWQDLKSKLPEYQLDGEPGSKETNTGGGGALREWSTHWYTENNSHRHISHLYAAWPAYDTKNDKIWENSVRASRDFSIETDNGEIKPLPIVIIDRTYIAIKEKEKIDDLERKFRETGNPDLINRIIVDSENNRTGNTFCDEIRNTLFSPQILQDRIARIEKIIQELETRDKQTAKKCIQMLINTTLEEEQKYECFGYNKTLKTERGYNHNEYINRWIEEYNRPDDIVEFREQCLCKDGKKQVAKYFKEIIIK